MDMQELVAGFLASSHGQNAQNALVGQGIDPTQANVLLGHATEAAANHINAQHPAPTESEGGLLGSLLGQHAGRNFLAGIAAGIARGDGLAGSLEDGALGVVTGRITEALVEKAGLDGGTASTVAAAATPFIAGYLKEKLGKS
jgi:hypothetical protein